MNFTKLLILVLMGLPFFGQAAEPENIILMTKDIYKSVEFSSIKPTTLKTVNHHPNFAKAGPIEYQGYLFRDLLKEQKIKPEQPILLVATTGQFVLELKAQELLSDDVILATHKNGQRIDTKDFGNQIIYGAKILEKNPELKSRHHWLWWVRSLIIDNAYKNDFDSHKIPMTKLNSTIPFPQPDGESSIKKISSVKMKEGKILDTIKAKEIKMTLINDSILEIPTKSSFSYFLTNSNELMAGGETLYVVEIKNNKISNIVASHFYLKSLEIIK